MVMANTPADHFVASVEERLDDLVPAPRVQQAAAPQNHELVSQRRNARIRQRQVYKAHARSRQMPKIGEWNACPIADVAVSQVMQIVDRSRASLPHGGR